MYLSNYFALVIGFYLFFLSLAMLVHQNRYKKVIAHVLGDAPLLTLTGALGIVFGLIITISHNVWCGKWPVLVTLFGWVMLIQGLMRLFVPEYFARLNKVLQAKVGFTIFTWAWFLIGLYLVWVGFTQ